MTLTTQEQFFHSCGATVILREDSFLEIIRPYCPVCKKFLDIQDYKHLAQIQEKIVHSPSQSIIIDYSPTGIKNNNGCTHAKKTFLQYSEARKINVFRCQLCNQIVRERD